jgi:hypothetical protein
LGCSGRTGQSASAFSNVRQELRNLERIALLLQELVVKSSFLGLVSLLLLLASGHLSLGSRNLCSLVLHAKIGNIHATSLCNTSGLGGITKNVLANASSGLRTLKALRELLIAKTLNSLTLTNILCIQILANLTQLRTSAKVLLEARLAKLVNLSASAKSLTILLLTKSREASANAKLLAILLLAKSRSLLGCLLLGCTVGLCRSKTNTLLLLSCGKSLLIVCLIKTSDSLPHCKGLLLGKVSLRNTRTVATKSASLNGIAFHLPTLLGLLLLQESNGWVDYILLVLRAQIGLKIQPLRSDVLRPRLHIVLGLLVQGLRSLKRARIVWLSLIGVLLTSSDSLLRQIGCVAKILLSLPKSLLRKPSFLLHVRRSRIHRVTKILASLLVIRSALLLGLTNALQGRLVNGVGLILTGLGSLNALHLQTLALTNGLICGALKSINVANARLLRRS